MLLLSAVSPSAAFVVEAVPVLSASEELKSELPA